MRFIDRVKITVKSGRGGDGCTSFRREKFIPKGGPDGGDGGRGGSVYLEGDPGLNTLIKFRGQKNYLAEDGASGSGQQKSGRFGQDMILKVPVGTIVKETHGREVVADITRPKQRVLIAKGGEGGLGNIHFKSSVNQAPRKSTDGEPGQALELELELKLIADVALIGVPNAGKSTCLSHISKARPKIADYPFTTLVPHLGVVEVEEGQSCVVADIPGLIEKASEGKGLGIQFLRHIERTKAFVHLVDISWCLDPFEAFEQYVVVREELAKYSEKLIQKKEIVCLTKVDAMPEKEVQEFVHFFEKQLDRRVLPLSAVSGKNIVKLKELIFRVLE